MKVIRLFIGALLCFFSFGCGEEDGKEINGGGGGNTGSVETDVPLSIIGKDLHFGSSAEDLFFSLLQTEQGVKVVMADGWDTNNTSCKYEKVDANRASIHVDFDLKLGLQEAMQHSYKMDLNFSSAHKGTYTANHRWKYGTEVTETKEEGFFGYDTGNTEVFDEKPKPDVNFYYLHRSWVSQGKDTTRYVTFYDDKSYLLVTKAANYYKTEKGQYSTVKDAYLLSLIPEGTEEKVHYRILTLKSKELTWISYLAATGKPVDPETFVPSDVDGVEAAALAEDVVSIRFTFVSPQFIQCEFYWNAGRYDVKGDKISVGLCYATSPHPEITDEVSDWRVSIPLEEEKDESSYKYHSIKDLKAGTVYYVRPFTIIDGKPFYFKEFLVETVGNHIQAELKPISYCKMKVSYKINQKGTYHVRMFYTSPLVGGVYRDDFGYKKQGDSGEFVHAPFCSGSFHHFTLRLQDMETGIIYQSNTLDFEN